MSKILVTGGKGFIGSHLIDELVKEYEVYSFDNSFAGFGNKYINPLAHQICGDIRNFEHIDFAIKNVDYVIHLAAISHVKSCLENPKLCMDINIGGTTNVLESCRINNIKRVIIAGSDHIYGMKNFKYQPIDERHPLLAINESDPYGYSKAIQVSLAQTYYRLYGVPIIITASGNVFSERQSIPNVIPSFIYKAINNENLIIHGDGNQTREFYHISNLINAYKKCLCVKNIEGEMFNISGNNEITINCLAQKILKLIPQSKSKIIHINDNKLNAMNKMSLNINKAIEKLDYKIITSFDVGLKNTINKYIEYEKKSKNV